MAGYQVGSPAVDNLNSVLRNIALRIMAESGGRVWIGSGWRSMESQADLYNRWRAGTYDVPAVAAPGKSKHNHGLAIDFGGDLRLAQQLGRKYGLIFPVKGEAWHAQLGEGVDPGASEDFLGMQLEGNDPKDVLANRMQAIMRTIGNLGGGATPGIPATSAMIQANRDSYFGGPVNDIFEYDIPAQEGQEMTARIADPAEYGRYARNLFKQFGFSEEDYPALVALWNRESGDPAAGSNRITWNPLADNPTSTAFGIAQFLDGTWKGTGIQKTVNPQQQILAGLMYIKSRYGNPRQALAFHDRNNWY